MSGASSGSANYGEKSNELVQKTYRDTDSASTEADQEEVEQVYPSELENGTTTNEKAVSKHSVESIRPALTRVASRITTHSFTDPGPPPDGGLQAWVQVAMSWLSVVATWGWVNCYGMSYSFR